MMTSIIRFLNIILTALLAGISLGIWLGFNPMNLSPATYIEQQQNMLRSLNTLMISLVIITTVITIFSAVIQKGDKPVFIALLVASAFLISCILISKLGNQPINDTIMTWTTVSSLPSDWTSLRNRWWDLHIMRTITELIALCLVTWTSIRKK